MAKASAGILVFRRDAAGLRVLLVHPGGPLWAKKDAGAWSIPKGHIEPNEEPFAAAKREFLEETGFDVPPSPPMPLAPVKLKSGRTVVAWAVEDRGRAVDAAAIRSEKFTMEWPPKSGRTAEFPEIDRAEFFRTGRSEAPDQRRPGAADRGTPADARRVTGGRPLTSSA